MKQTKKPADVVWLLLLALFVSCSENEGITQKENLPEFVNRETVTVWDEDIVKLNTSGTFDLEKYDLFVGDSKQEYNTEPASLVFKAKYSMANENKELSIVLKDKQGNIVATGGKIIILRTYRYYPTSMGQSSLVLPTFILENDKRFSTFIPGAYYENEIAIRHYDYSGGINDSIWSKDRNNNAGGGLFSISATIYPDPPAINPAILPVNRNDRFQGLGFVKQGVKLYIPIINHPAYPILCVADGVHRSLYQHNNQDVYFYSQPTDMVADSRGNLFAYCMNSPAIYKLDETNGIQLFAGSETESGYRDGKGADARFGTPCGDGIRNMLIDSNDNLYVAEKTKIRKISPDGTVSTFIGTDESADVVGSMDKARFADIKFFALTKKNVIYLTEEKTDYIKIIDPDKQSVTKIKVVGVPGYSDQFNTFQHFRMVVNEQGILFMDRATTSSSSAVTILCPTDQQKP